MAIRIINNKDKLSEVSLSGTVPKINEVFYYKSKYMSEPLEGLIKDVINRTDSKFILSTNGTKYHFSEISTKPLAICRDEKLTILLNDRF